MVYIVVGRMVLGPKDDSGACSTWLGERTSRVLHREGRWSFVFDIVVFRFLRGVRGNLWRTASSGLGKNRNQTP